MEKHENNLYSSSKTLKEFQVLPKIKEEGNNIKGIAHEKFWL